MYLQSLLKCLPHYQIDKNENPQITSLEMDSREVKKGSLFFCIQGYTVDGHDFARIAEKNGAVAVISERHLDIDIPLILVNDTKRAMAVLADFFYGQPTKKLHLIGVTGTNGKTTVTHILERIFQEAGRETGIIGTIHMKIKDTVIPVKNTTPESLFLQKSFHQMIEEGVSTAFMEVSSHALHMGRVRGCDFKIAIFTNLTQDHLDYHETMDAYMQAKGLLFAQLGNSFDPNNPKFAVLNADDEASATYDIMTAAHVLTYGIDMKADVMAKDITLSNQGTTFTLTTPVGSLPLSIKMVGRFSVYNVLAAASAAIVSSIPLAVIKRSVETMKGVPGRFELITEGQDFTIIVDYAHTPDSLENVLTTVKQFAKKETIVVVGCGGNRDKTKRPKMAAVATEYGDRVIFTSDNPRKEDPLQILQDMEKGATASNYTTIVDRKQAIYEALRYAKKDDVVVIAGKGHETYQEVGEERYRFDDREVARLAIREGLK